MSLQDSCLNLELLNLAQPFGWLAPELQSHSLTQNVLAQCEVTNTDLQDIMLRSGLVEDQSTLAEEPLHTELLHDETPLVLFQQCLYMRRYFNYEHSVVKFISSNTNLKENTKPSSSKSYWFDALSNEQVESTVAELFPPSQGLDQVIDNTSNEIDWQKQAVINSITKSFSVISGGPGTGKTTTVVKLLAALVQLYKAHDSKSGLNIQLTAPTGKAAQRLAESISNSLTNIDVDQETKSSIPNKAVTIHRLLKPQGLNDFAYNENNKLFLDVLIVDEASMVDLSLMSKLLSAVPAHAQVILLGDKQQLSSVETGNVLSELCRPETESLNLVVELKKSYRFNAAGLIGRLATEINLGNSHKVIALLSEHANTNTQKLSGNELNWIKPELDNYHLLIEHSFKHQLALIEEAKAFTESTDTKQKVLLLQALFHHLQQFQILTCVKDGEHGIEGINRHIKIRLASRRLVNEYEQHYHCRPIMISENAYHLGLYNGDIGLQLIDGVTKQLMTYFIQADGEVLTVACQRLPKHETVYAMTVHKSQGSEFSHVALVLPEPNQNNKILSKEILYTGLTRAKKQFTMFGQAQEIHQAVNKATIRQSGLSLMLKTKLQATG
jgi:exodeoxyribonuclease V alpha subunit